MNKKKSLLNEKGQLSFFIIFIILVFTILVTFVFFAPLLIDFNTRIYASANDILADANVVASQIDDPATQAQFQSAISSSANSIPEQTEILSFFFQYAWIILVVAVTMAIYLYTRRSVETQGGMA